MIVGEGMFLGTCVVFTPLYGMLMEAVTHVQVGSPGCRDPSIAFPGVL